jgi:hypothetical protein
MIVATVPLSADRSARLFVRNAADVALFTPMVAPLFMEEDDREREPALREVLAKPLVFVDAHSGIDPADVQHLFVRATEDPDEIPLLACAIATEARVEQALAEARYVAETFSFQVSLRKLVTPAGTIAAFEGWFERTFPDMRLPIICFARLSETIEQLELDLDEQVRQGEHDDAASLPSSVDNVQGLVAA